MPDLGKSFRSCNVALDNAQPGHLLKQWSRISFQKNFSYNNFIFNILVNFSACDSETNELTTSKYKSGLLFNFALVLWLSILSSPSEIKKQDHKVTFSLQ